MSAVPLDDKSQLKRHILRGVYEDNVDIHRPGTPRPRASVAAVAFPEPSAAGPSRRHAGFRSLVAILLLALAFAAAALTLHEDTHSWLERLSTLGAGGPAVAPGPQSPPEGPELAAGSTFALGGGAGVAPSMEAALGGLGPPEPMWQSGIALESPADYAALLQDSRIPIADLFGLEVNTIVIDPGHGGADPGAIGAGGLQEKEVTLDIARRLRERLSAHGNIRVLLTRSDDSRMSLKERVAFAKARNADLFVSIHVNALPVDRITMIETYYFGPHQDEESLLLAERENEGSEFAVGDFKEIIAKIGDTMKTQESKVLATSIQRNLFQNIKRRNRDVVSWGIKTAPFVVLLGVDVPSVLAEVSCITHPEEEQRLATPGYRDEIAQYLEEGIVDYLRKSARDKEEPTDGALKYAAREESE